MIGLDTNILLRYLTKDQTPQTDAACKFIDDTIESGQDLFVNHIVLFELFWVMKKIYNLSKAQIIGSLDLLLDSYGIIIENEDDVSSALQIYADNNVDFSDALIAVGNLRNNVDYTMTFDKKAANKINGFKLLNIT